MTSPYMSAKERSRWSLKNLILTADSSERGLEKEVSAAMARDIGRQPVGLFVPPEIIFGPDHARRILGITNSTGGAFTVGDSTTAIPLIDFLFPQSVIFRLGAKMITQMRSDVTVPRVSASDEGEWLAEAASATAGSHDSEFGQVVVDPKRVYAERRCSRQLLAQTPEGETLLKKLVMGAVAAALDRAALAGSGGVQLIGILNDPNTPTVSIGAAGGAPTLAVLNDCEHAPIAAKVQLTAPGWVVSPAARRKLKNTQKATGTSSFLLETAGNEDRVNGFTGHATAYLPDNGVKTSGTNLGSAIFGAEWSTIIACIFGGFDLLPDTITRARHGEFDLSINIHADIAKTRPEAFAKVTDIVTTT